MIDTPPAFQLARATQSENAMLGLCVLSSDHFELVASEITADDLFRKASKVAWRAMASLHEDRQTWDPMSLADRLRTDDRLDAVGGCTGLMNLVIEATSPKLLPHYAGLVREAALRRRIQGVGADLLSRGEDEDPTDLATELEGLISDVASSTAGEGPDFAHQVRHATKELIDRWDRGSDLLGISTGYSCLDGFLSGLCSSDLVLLAARPSIGKTAIALNLTENILATGQPVMFVSLEMSRAQLIHRMIASRSGVPLSRVRTNPAHDAGRVQAAGLELEKLPLALTDRSAMSVPEIRAFAKAAIKRQGPGPLIVDYLGMIRGDGHAENRNLEVAEISRGLKSIAKDLEIPVLALSQLSRKPEQRQDRRPALSDLRDSGTLEQDADVVLLLHREDRGSEDAELNIAKHRNGPTGVVMFKFDGASVRFNEVGPENPFRPQPVNS